MMNTGLKQLDALIQKHGIHFSPDINNPFEQVIPNITANECVRLKLPYCIFIKAKECGSTVLVRFKLPFKHDEKLADFLIDMQGNTVEQVYYQRHVKYKNACRQLEHVINKQLKSEATMLGEQAKMN